MISRMMADLGFEHSSPSQWKSRLGSFSIKVQSAGKLVGFVDITGSISKELKALEH